MTRTDDIKAELKTLTHKAKRNRRHFPTNDWLPTATYVDTHQAINDLVTELEELEFPPVAPPVPVFSDAP